MKKFLTLLCALILLVGCAAVPTSVNTFPPPTLVEVTPTPVPERKKLFDDGLYVTLPNPYDVWAIEPEWIGVPYGQHLVYDNYGDLVAEFYSSSEYFLNVPVVCGKSAIIPCTNFGHVYNLFSYETLSYVIDDTFPIKNTTYDTCDYAERPYYRRAGDGIFKVYDDEVYKYAAPSNTGPNIGDLSDTMLYAYSSEPSQLILYKSGENISYLLDNADFPDGVSVSLNKGYAIISKIKDEAHNETEYTIIDSSGKILYQCVSNGIWNIAWPGEIDYSFYDVGHDMSYLRRGNYHGIINSEGEWLIKTLWTYTD